MSAPWLRRRQPTPIDSPRLYRDGMPLLRPFLRGSLLLGPSSSEDACHGVIPLVTRILKHRSRNFRHGHRSFPGFRPHRWIVDREFVEERVGVDTPKAFDDMEVF